LAGDARHLAAASQVELQIALDPLPLEGGVSAEAELLGITAGQFAAEAGEDYELLVALSPGFGSAADFTRECGIGLTNIGSVGQGTGVRFLSQEGELRLKGYDHFG
jgi:thiamine monophosphate kinase